MVRPWFGHGPFRSPPLTAGERTRSPPRWPAARPNGQDRAAGVRSRHY